MPVRETQLRPNSLHVERLPAYRQAGFEVAKVSRDSVQPERTPLWRGRGGMQTNAVFRPRAYLAFNGASALMRMPMTIILNQHPKCPKGTRWVKSIMRNKTRQGCQRRNGTWHGPYKSTHPNGKKMAEGTYVNGKKYGLWKSWHPNGKKKLEGRYVNGKKYGLWEKWHTNGKKNAEGKYVNGKAHGLVKAWHTNGKKRVEGRYVNGRRHGPYTIWHDNGKKFVEGKYVNGKVHGLVKEWHSNGKKHGEGAFVNGKRHGTAQWWDKNGALVRIENYAGKLWMRLANGGTIEGYYRNGKEHGVVVTKDRSGRVIKRCTMVMGVNKGCTRLRW